jgi:hypothetical protein
VCADANRVPDGVALAAHAVAHRGTPLAAVLQQRAGDHGATPDADRPGGAAQPAAGLADRLVELFGGLQPHRSVGHLRRQPFEQLQQVGVAAADHPGEVAHDPRRGLDILVQPGLQPAGRDADLAGRRVDGEPTLGQRLDDLVGPALPRLMGASA